MEVSMIHLLAVLALAWSAGLIAFRLGFPAILGELAAGIIFGPAVLGSMGLGFSGPVPGLEMLAQVGVFALMLFIGMEVNYRDLIRNGVAGALAAAGGFVVPFGVGYAIAIWAGYGPRAGAFLGMAMAVTSLATKSRILVDLNLFGTRIANVLLSGALLADVGALLMFALVLGFMGQEGVDAREIMYVLVSAGGFFLIAAVCGLKLLPMAGSLLQRINVTERTGTFTFVLIVGLVYAEGAHLMGLHPIIGAFLAGAFLRQGVLKQRLSVDVAHVVRDLAVGFLAPIFFFTAGFHVRLGIVVEQPLLVVLVIVAATLSKVIGTALFYAFSGNGWREGLVIGAGMNGRGAVEIIIAEIALGMGLIDNNLFSILVLMAIFTTLTVPVALKLGTQWLDRRDELVRSDDDRRGLLIIGATPLGRLIARQAAAHSNEPVYLVDLNPQRCQLARKEGLPVVRGNALREDVMILAGARDASSLVALTPNASINQLVCQFAREHFGVPNIAKGWPEPAAETNETTVKVPALWPVSPADIERKLWEHRAEHHPGETEREALEGKLEVGRLSASFIADRAQLPLLILRAGRALLPSMAKLKPTDQVVYLKRPQGRAELDRRFKEAVAKAPVLDFKKKTGFTEFLNRASESIAEHASEPAKNIRALFEKREQEFSSVLVPGLAIPHAALPGERPFLILLARAREGIIFPGHEHPVRTVFLLLGGETDRDIHLYALSEIARSVSRPGFEVAWLGAPDEQALLQFLTAGGAAVGVDAFEEELGE